MCNYLMVLDYLAGALVPSCRHVDDEIDEEGVGDEVQVEEEPVPLCQLGGNSTRDIQTDFSYFYSSNNPGQKWFSSY